MSASKLAKDRITYIYSDEDWNGHFYRGQKVIFICKACKTEQVINDFHTERLESYKRCLCTKCKSRESDLNKVLKNMGITILKISIKKQK